MSYDREDLKRRIRERLSKEGKPRAERRKPPWKLTVGIGITIIAFFIVVFVLNAGLGWPTSLFTLGGMLALAWFVSVIAGERIATPRLATIAASVLVVALAASTLGFGVPWRIGEVGEREYVRFDYRAMFIYLRPENGEPLGNLSLRFAAPQIENEFVGRIYSGWELYYIEDDNKLTLQATLAGIVNLRGSRTSQLEIIGSGIENSFGGPALTWTLNRLYPREVFVDYGWVDVPKKRANAVTLRDYNVQEDWSWAQWHTYEAEANPENWRIDFSFAIGLYRENTLIEKYEITWENQTWGAFSLLRKV